jgi:hypothetical protein
MTDSQKVVCPPDAFIRATGQLWKLILGGVVLPISLTIVGLLTRPSESESFADLGWLVGGASAVVLLLASVACPRCRRRLLTDVFRAPDGNAAITRFLATRTCPSCGHDPQRLPPA